MWKWFDDMNYNYNLLHHSKYMNQSHQDLIQLRGP